MNTSSPLKDCNDCSVQIRTPDWQKRLLDLALVVPGLLVASPLLVVTAVVIALTSPGPVFFRQERVGRFGHSFQIWKFRSMVVGADQMGHAPNLTKGADQRVTPVGRVLRRTKLDELPQLFNVLMGEMTFVGPRPELAHYVALYPQEQRGVLCLKPGITSVASVVYHNEPGYLSEFGEHAEQVFVTLVIPHKNALCLNYAAQATLLDDLRLIVQTVLRSAI